MLVDSECWDDWWGLSELGPRRPFWWILVKLPAWQPMKGRVLYVIFGQKVSGLPSWHGEQRESERRRRTSLTLRRFGSPGSLPVIVVGGYDEGDRYSITVIVEYDRLAIRNPSPSPRCCVDERHRVVKVIVVGRT
jgi:hypothetical protein